MDGVVWKYILLHISTIDISCVALNINRWPIQEEVMGEATSCYKTKAYVE